MARKKIASFIAVFALIVCSCTGCAGAKDAAVSAQGTDALPDELIALGHTAGIRLYCEGALVVSLSEVECDNGAKKPGSDAGIRIGDIITSLGGTKVKTIDDVIAFMENASGADIAVEYMRGENARSASLTPVRSKEDGMYKLGLMIRDSAAGIGTLTYLDPESGRFGGLGHGIQDADTGKLFNIGSGDASSVIITGIIKGYKDEPGELQGMFLDGAEKIGTLYVNSDVGVYGIMSPESSYFNGEKIKTAKNGEISTGKAEILTNLLSNNVETFEIEVEKVYNFNTKDTKNMLIKITDQRLLDATGGIIQGMSGSPIIQNGKLVGAVTHVLVHDPTRGYAISIENMLTNSSEDYSIVHAA